MKDFIFPVLMLLLVGVLTAEFLIGATLPGRKWLQAVAVALFLLVALTTPSCSNGDQNEPDGPDIPYSF